MDEMRPDDQLAELTDAILDRRDQQPLPELRDDAELVLALRDLIRPEEEPPDAFREQLRARMAAEFDALPRRAQSRRPTMRPALRLALAAASVVLVLAALLLFDVVDTPGSLFGAAAGVTDAGSLGLGLLLIGGAGLIALVVWRRR
jgi:hypothetical protein